MKNKIVIILIAALLVATVGLACSVLELNRNIDALSNDFATQADLIETLSKVSTEQADMIDELSEKSESMQSDVENIYDIATSHENCVALSMFVNADSILADMYDRTEEAQKIKYGDDVLECNFYGRLYVPDANIDVALYYTNSQFITDRADSANLYMWATYSGEIIADHSDQEFRKLFNVEVGTEGYIRTYAGDIINIRCIEVLNGHNTGLDLTDEDGKTVMGTADYLMYTCRSGWQNIRICRWNKY